MWRVYSIQGRRERERARALLLDWRRWYPNGARSTHSAIFRSPLFFFGGASTRSPSLPPPSSAMVARVSKGELVMKMDCQGGLDPGEGKYDSPSTFPTEGCSIDEAPTGLAVLHSEHLSLEGVQIEVRLGAKVPIDEESRILGVRFYAMPHHWDYSSRDAGLPRICCP